MKPEDEEVKATDHIRRVFACATMWHETADEMKQMLKSVFRMDFDKSARKLAKVHLKIMDPDYYVFQGD
jgi:chitin synthase